MEGPGERRRAKPRKLSQEDWQERQRRGLCFKCGELWGQDHICLMRQMHLILVEDDEDEHEDKGEEPGEDQGEQVLQHMKISLNSFVGLTSNKSFKVEGSIGGRKVLVLVDSGVLDNFLTTQLARELELEVKQLPTFTIEVGNGQKERGDGVCCGVKL